MKCRTGNMLAGTRLAPVAAAVLLMGTAFLVFLSCGTGPVHAQPVSGSAGALAAAAGPDGSSPFAAVAEVVIPTVVNISVEKTVHVTRSALPGEGGPFDEFFRRFLPDQPGRPLDRDRSALGSGVIISPDGYIVTNNHVVADFDRIVVRLSDGTELKGKQVRVVGRDPRTDLAVIKVETDHRLQAISFGRVESVRVGDWAIAVGNAFGLQSTVTVGIVSAKGRSGLPLPEGPSYQDFIQTDASINPGNSGGALVNIRGELIGINSAIRSPVGASVGIGFAAPVDMVQNVTAQLIEKGRVVRGFLGISPQPVTEAIRLAMKLKSTDGVLVGEVVKDMPAERAGVKAGDVIAELDDTSIRDVEQFRRLVADYAPGTAVSLTIVRDGRESVKQVTLVELADTDTRSAPGEMEPEKWFGLQVRSASAVEQDDGAGGVVVESVKPGSPAYEAGIQSGDAILEVGGEQVASVAEFLLLARRLSGGDDAVLVRLQRAGRRFFAAVEPER